MHRLNRYLKSTLVMSCLLASACGAPPPAPEPMVRPVRYVAVEPPPLERTRTFAGVARARAESSLAFRVAGTIADVHVDVGDRVRAGAPIARLDSFDLELLVKEAEAALRQAAARADNAVADLRRARALYVNDNISQTDLDAAVAAADSAAAQVEAAEKRLELARRQVRYTRLVAPLDGAIAAVHAAANEHATPGQPVVVLASGGLPEVEFDVPEGLIRQVREETPVSVRVAAIPGVRFEGTVTEVGVATQGTGTLFPVAVRLNGDASAVRPGMAAEVAMRFGGGEVAGRFVLPSQAVGEDQDGRFVFVAEPTADGLAVARRRAVTVGAFAPRGLEIVAGLAPGTRVVSAGVSRIADGDIVRLNAAWATTG